MSEWHVSTEPGAVATGCYIQGAIDNFRPQKDLHTRLSAWLRSLPLPVLYSAFLISVGVNLGLTANCITPPVPRVDSESLVAIINPFVP